MTGTANKTDAFLVKQTFPKSNRVADVTESHGALNRLDG